MIVLKAAQQDVLAALQSVAGIVERRHTLPILANVLMRKNGAAVEFTTSDLEIQVRTAVELGGDAGAFSTTVGARKMIDILRSLPSDQVVSLSAAQSKLALQGGANEFAEAWRVIMQLKHEPMALILTRQALPTIDRSTYAPASGVAKGGYVLADVPGGKPNVLLLASGSEVSLCLGS